MRHGKRRESFTQPRCIADKIERDNLHIRIGLRSDALQRAPPKRKVAKVRHDDAHELSAHEHALLGKILRQLLG